MSKLEELIQKLCPDGVEFRPLSEMATIQRGERITKKDLVEDGAYPVISGGMFPMGRFSSKNRDANTITISSYGAAGYIGFVKEDFWANDVCLSVFPNESIVNNKYLYYALLVKQTYIYSNTTKAIPDHIPTQFLLDLSIPVPPIEVQCEIVRILDNFTELTAELTTELTTELTARKKQYEYYRDTVIISNQNVPMVKLGGFAEIIRGGNFQKKDFTDEGRPCIHYGQMYTHFGVYTDKTIKYVSEETFNKSKQAVPNDIVMAVTSENVEDVCSCTAWVGEEAIAVSGHTAIIHHNQNAKYLSYYFHTSHFFSQKKKLAHGIKVIEVTPSKLADILVPLPSLEEQARIVSILDRFDVIFDDISTGLLAEIEARQKQYEYYRDKLLTFKELKV